MQKFYSLLNDREFLLLWDKSKDKRQAVADYTGCSMFNPNGDKALHQCFGDFADETNFYQLVVGRKWPGSINKDSLRRFSIAPNHFYICTNSDFSRLHILNAQKLVELIKDGRLHFENDEYIASRDYEAVL